MDKFSYSSIFLMSIILFLCEFCISEELNCSEGCIECYKCPDLTPQVNCSTNACFKCEDGFFLDIKKRESEKGNIEDSYVCEKCLKNCKKCLHFRDCLECESGYYLNMGTCVKNDIEEEKSECEDDSNRNLCKQCENKKCKKCADFYQLKDGKCLPCTLLDDNCLECGDGKCITCKLGFYMNSEQKCVECQKTSQIYNQTYYTPNTCVTSYSLEYCENDNEAPCKKCRNSFELDYWGECTCPGHIIYFRNYCEISFKFILISYAILGIIAFVTVTFISFLFLIIFIIIRGIFCPKSGVITSGQIEMMNRGNTRIEFNRVPTIDNESIIY